MLLLLLVGTIVLVVKDRTAGANAVVAPGRRIPRRRADWTFIVFSCCCFEMMMMTMATISWRGVNVVVEEGGSVGYVLYDTREPARSMTYAL